MPKPFFLFWIILFFSCKNETQKNIQLTQVNFNDSVTYVKKALQFMLEVEGRSLADSTFTLEDQPVLLNQDDCLKMVMVDSAIFSKIERDSLSKKAQHVFIKNWTNQLFPTIQIVNADTIRHIFRDPSKGWDYIHTHIGRAVHAYSVPVFLKMDEYCLFYTTYSCGRLCAEGSLGLYRKTGGHWLQIKSYCHWVS